MKSGLMDHKACMQSTSGADPGEVKWVNFHPLFLSPLLSFFSYPSNIEIVFDFSGIITKIHPPFQNPRSAPVLTQKTSQQLTTNTAFSLSACKMDVHKRCHKNVANNCGVNPKEMADVLKGMGLTGNKLSESMRVKKVCKLELDELAVEHPWCLGT